MNQYEGKRNSYLENNELYFWTATIHKWKHLMKEDIYKQVVVDSLHWLVQNKLAEVYSFVIMPNHIHLVWQVLKKNGRESPQGSFLKYTAHTFRKMLYTQNKSHLIEFKVDAANKKHEFWQRDSLAIPLFSKEMIYQKIDYIHNDPVASHWKLSNSAKDYKFSSALFYEDGIDNFGILKHINEIL